MRVGLTTYDFEARQFQNMTKFKMDSWKSSNWVEILNVWQIFQKSWSIQV